MKRLTEQSAPRITILITRFDPGCDIQVNCTDMRTLRRLYRVFMAACLRVDKRSKLLRHGPVASGDYSFLIDVPGLSYEQACQRIEQIFPATADSYPHALIGG